MDPASIAILLASVLKVAGGLAGAIHSAASGEILTDEQQAAITDARKLAHQSLLDSIDAKLDEA